MRNKATIPKRDIMPEVKTIADLEKEFSELRENLQAKYHHKEYFTPFTGNSLLDFSQFTQDQSGRKSDDPNDPAAKNAPPSPDTDGHYYHTINDVIWSTYHSIFPQRPPSMFYNMTKEERATCIDKFIEHGKYCGKDSINKLCSYIAWGSWDFQPEISLYKTWYGTDARPDAETHEHDTFVRLIDIRKYRYSVMNNHELYSASWTLGILNFWHLFIQYIK
jgi:hypothetical protein